MTIVSANDFIESVQGLVIEGGAVNEDGLHLMLGDGRVLVILGVVYVGNFEKETLQ